MTANLRALAALGMFLCAAWAPSCARERAPADAGVVTLSVDGRAGATPWIAADGSRVAVSWGARGGDGATDVYVAVSADGGRTFGAPARVDDRSGTARLSGEMPPRVVFVPGAGGAPSLDVLWTARENQETSIRIARSDDGGRTFGPSRALQDASASGDRGWPALAADPAGAVHALWLDHRVMADHASAGDGHHHHAAGGGTAAADGVAMALRSGLYYGGESAEHEVLRGVCYCCKTALAAGPAGELFAAWRHVYPGNIRDIAFTASRDGGRTFAAPARVSEDQWQLDGCPDDGPAMAVDAGGMVHLVWPTVVSQPAPHKALFYAATRDGHSFTPRVRVSPQGRNIAHPQVAVSPAGARAVFWDEIVGGRRQVFVSRQAADGSAFGAPEALSDNESASYPVPAFADGAFVVAWTDGGGDDSVIVVRRVGMR